MTGLFIDIEPYIVDLEEEKMERALQEAVEQVEEYRYYPSAMNYRACPESKRPRKRR
jgi:hypothetical protein